MYRILSLLTDAEIAACRKIAAESPFVDGRITNPHMKAKQNEQLHEPEAYQKSSRLLMEAFGRSEEFREFAFPASMTPPFLTRYRPGMKYGFHTDSAYLRMPGGQIRSDLSCTVFLSDPDSYEGGHLHIQYGDSDLRFKLRPGEVVVYPSDTMHEVEPVTKGERLVAVTFIQSLVPDPFQRNLLYNLNEVAALEGLNMTQENFMQLQLIQNQLLRYWGEKP
jgi:PKHD-type hydroxylase